MGLLWYQKLKILHFFLKRKIRCTGRLSCVHCNSVEEFNCKVRSLNLQPSDNSILKIRSTWCISQDRICIFALKYINSSLHKCFYWLQPKLTRRRNSILLYFIYSFWDWHGLRFILIFSNYKKNISGGGSPDVLSHTF